MNYGRVIGVGRTATVYEYTDNKVLKLFNKGYPKEAVEKEFNNALAINNLNFSKPKAYEVVDCRGQIGIVYDRVDGQQLTDWVLKTGDLQGCATIMANLHKSILHNSINNVPNYKDFLRHNIKNTFSANSESLERALALLGKLSDGNTLCHGDFHPGNILIQDGETTVIDFMNICHGDSLYDIARTVFLVEYTPLPEEVEDKEMIMQFRKALIDLYLKEMSVTREMIENYLTIIIAVRKGECPEEGKTVKL